MLVLGGGMAVQRPAEALAGEDGRPITRATACPRPRRSATCNPVDSTEFSGMIGLPLPNTDIEDAVTTTATKCRSASRARSHPRARR
jgi:long-chain acyl-CoA synthetase